MTSDNALPIRPLGVHQEARRHLRFALRDVTFGGLAINGATIDTWEDDRGRLVWSGRVMTRTAPVPDEGELAGWTKDGEQLSGHAFVADRSNSPGGRHETLVEFHGTGTLERVVREVVPRSPT